MKNKLFLGLVAIMFVTVFASCDKVPQAEIDAANAALVEAQTAGAEMYIPQDYLIVKDSLNAILEKVEVQKSKFFKKFGECKEQLVGVTTLATDLKAKTEVRKEEVKKELEVALEEVKVVMEENNTLLTKAPKGKEGKAALEQIKAELVVLETSIVEATNMLTNGDFLAGLDKVKATKEKAASINEELKAAIAKVRR
ncbi:MAG: hypothetical protein A2X13_13935 [Bacteroidetes bacterium GWC2_33_15]|nr:MAG: hypothetical protein A2X10_09150 [Bacteroidetes bacterium GWA2_33_15]OFX50446.1 MAG: hypothetical protein A2X13_13935 [Bacteroidetes bacterium GWC2_33_15]OFX66636.1 MAG: hypothetical protein A2X15_07940 [Bacteroidetes bacterium GWB2_32_14]OFX69254.1 MAG: hypothetical protein A2X14_08870 [Bacteroidetes bacterium GWD2_33_33]HAN18568.1 hypothetical protein [Bacteroidales bacterium]